MSEALWQWRTASEEDNLRQPRLQEVRHRADLPVTYCSQLMAVAFGRTARHAALDRQFIHATKREEIAAAADEQVKRRAGRAIARAIARLGTRPCRVDNANSSFHLLRR